MLTALLFGAATISTACGTNETAKSVQNDPPLVVGTQTLSAHSSVLWWAKAKGYFEEAGLDVSISMAATAQTTQLVSGQTDIFMGSQAALLNVINSGKPVKTIYEFATGSSAYVVTAKDSVKSPADCKTISSAPTGTVFNVWTHQLEKIFKADWKVSQLNSIGAISSNVVSGRTDCANGALSYYQRSLDEGKLRLIFDPTDEAGLPADWPKLGAEDVFGGLPRTLDKKRSSVEKFLKVYHAATKDFIAADSGEIAQTLIEYEPDWAAAVGSRDVIAQTLSDFKPLFSPNNGYISEDTWTSTLDFFKNGGLEFLDGGASKFDYADVVDMSFYDAAFGK